MMLIDMVINLSPSLYGENSLNLNEGFIIFNLTESNNSLFN